MTYTIAAVKTVKQYLFDSKRPYQVFLHCWGPQTSPGYFRIQPETLVWPNYPISWSSGQTGRWWRLEHLWRLSLVWGLQVLKTRPKSSFLLRLARILSQRDIRNPVVKPLVRLWAGWAISEYYPVQLNTSTQDLIARKRCKQDNILRKVHNCQPMRATWTGSSNNYIPFAAGAVVSDCKTDMTALSLLTVVRNSRQWNAFVTWLQVLTPFRQFPK